MLVDSLQLLSGSVISNATIESSASLPSNSNSHQGQLYYLVTDTAQELYVFTGTTWVPVYSNLVNVSQLTNDAGYITESAIPTNVSQLTNDTDYATVSQVPTKVSQLTNDTDYATVSQVPTKVSQLTNDSDYATVAQLPVVPTRLSQLTNDDGFITAASPAFTGTPTAPTATNATNSTQLATTAFVQNIISSLASGINFLGTWNATTNTPTITSGSGVKGSLYKVATAGTTTIDGNSSWAVGDMMIFDGTTWDKIDGQATQVVSFNNRFGAITLNSTDITTALGFTPVNPATAALTGTPTAPTPAVNDNSTNIATTAFVTSAISAVTGGSGGLAPLASPAFTGTPTVPTATAGTSNSQAASTYFVSSAISTAISSLTSGLNYAGTWNAFTNTPTLVSNSGAKGTMYKVSVAGTTSINGVASWSVGDMILFDGTVWDKIDGQATQVISFNGRSGAITLSAADVNGALGYTAVSPTTLQNYAPLISPALTGTPTAPTPTANDNSANIATTAFVQTAINNASTGGGGSGTASIFSYFPGNISPLIGTLRYQPRATLQLTAITLFITTPPTNAITVDVLVNGVSIFGGSGYPTIPVGQSSSSPLTLTTTVTSSQYLTMNIIAGDGANMTARIDYNT